jgi:uncharacterized membrane protein YoaK (UPF0700 family)
MLLREGPARNESIDRALAGSLAFVAGAINAAAFYAAGFFAANMTGNVSAASDYLALGNWRSMSFYLLLVGAFIIGSCVSALLLGSGIRRGASRVYAYVLLGEAALLAAIGLLAPVVSAGHRPAFIVASLAFLMGLQNAVVTRISGAKVRTTHVSGMATDFGIGIAHLWEGWRGHGTIEKRMENRRRMALHATTIVAFFGGGVVGVLLYREIGHNMLLVAGAAVAGIALLGSRGVSAR